MKEIEIIPAILPKDWSEVTEKIELIQGFVNRVQIDICDGQYVPNATWPYRKHDQNFESLLKEEIGLPAWEDLEYEFDLMVNFKEESDLTNWQTIGASRLVIHINSRGDLDKMIDLANTVETGIAINNDTDISLLKKYEGKFQFVQCMGIDHVGFQGQNFDVKVLDKVKEVRAVYPDMPISVDGGVSEENARDLIQAGATRLIVGSHIFGEGEIIDNIQAFQRIAREAQ